MAKQQYSFDLPAINAGAITEGKFSAVVYSGGILYDHPSFPNGVIFDLATTALEPQTPVLLNHDRDKEAGFSSDLSIIDSKIVANGQLLSNEFGARIKDNAEQGFQWQLSPHIISRNIVKLSGNQKATINGLSIKAPTTIFTQNVIREISFTPVGVDGSTSAEFFNLNHEQQFMSDMPENVEEILSGLRYRLNLPELATPEEIFAELDKLKMLYEQSKATTEQAQTQVAAMQASLKELKDATREQEIKKVFAVTGKQFDKDKHGYLFTLDDSSFSSLIADLQTMKPPAPAELFSLPVVDAQTPNRESTAINTADIFAKRRQALGG